MEVEAQQREYMVQHHGSGNYQNYSGGGATDIRLVNGNWDSFEGLKSRIMVAAGAGIATVGGGIESDNSTPNSNFNSTVYCLGATQIQAGKTNTGTLSGSFGMGGDGENYAYGYGSAGGGGGYYGGSGAIATDWNGSGDRYGAGSSTGGSSFISGHLGCNAISVNSTENNIIHTGNSTHYSELSFENTQIIDGSGYLWANIRGTNVKVPNPYIYEFYQLFVYGRGVLRRWICKNNIYFIKKYK